MNGQTADAETEIKDLRGEPDAQIGPAPSPAPVRKRRRRHIRSLARVVIELDHVYFDLTQGRLSQREADTRSRILKRTGDALAQLDESTSRERMIQLSEEKLYELRRIQSGDLISEGTVARLLADGTEPVEVES